MKCRSTLLLSAVTILGFGAAWASPAAAGYTVVSGTGYQAFSSIVENFDTLIPLSTATAVLPSGVTVSFSGTAAPVIGALANRYAAPNLTGSNGVYFGTGGGTQASGPDATVYLSAGSTGADAASAVTLLMPSARTMFGILWGSVDAYNTITFYSGAAQVAAVNGSQVNVVSGAIGDQSAGGSSYVNVLFTGGTTYDRVVFTSADWAFEFDNFAMSSPVSVPEPLSVATLGLGVLGLGLIRRRRA